MQTYHKILQSVEFLEDELIGHCQAAFTSFSNPVLLQSFSHENEFDLHDNECADESNFHMNSFAQKLIF